MPTDIRRISIPAGKRIIAISDVHAHLNLLTGLLEKVGFCRDDELFIIGDMLAKGPESLETLRFLMRLDQQENVHVMSGNFENGYQHLIQSEDPKDHQMLLDHVSQHLKIYGHNFITDMLNELEIPITPDMNMAEALRLIREAYKDELAFLQSLPDIIETDYLIFVHGGIPTEDLESLRNQEARLFLKNDDFMSKGFTFSKYVIVGHWPVENYHKKSSLMPFVNHKQRIIAIDGGCGVKRDAQLNAFIITNEAKMEYSVIFHDNFPIRIAIDSQSESESFTNIRYGDHTISVLEKGDDESFIEHTSTGSRLWVPNDNIWHENGVDYCVYSDYKLPVQAGDALSVCREKVNSYWVKKNGLCGWYTGQFKC